MCSSTSFTISQILREPSLSTEMANPPWVSKKVMRMIYPSLALVSASVPAMKLFRPRRHARVFPETFGARLGSSMLHYGSQLVRSLLPARNGQSIRITAAFLRWLNSNGSLQVQHSIDFEKVRFSR